MSKSEKLLAFEAALQESKELQEKFAAAQKRIVENKEASSDGEVLMKAAAEVGFTLTMEEMERAFAQSQELNEEELEQVSGGAAFFCPIVFACYLTLLYYEGDEDCACFSNYQCVFFEN